MPATERERVVRPQDHQYRLPAPKFTRPAVIAAPPEPRSLHRYGDLADAPIVTICTIAAQVWPTPVNRRHIRDRGLRKMADYLTRYPGNSWQERWDASPLATTTIGDVVGDGRAIRSEFTQAAQAVFALRIIRPTLTTFRVNKFVNYTTQFIEAEHDPLLDAFVSAVRASPLSEVYRRWAVFDICAALTTQGIPFTDLTPEAFMHYAVQTRQSMKRTGVHYGKYAGHSAWQVLHAIGQFPASAPSTLRGALRAPQLTTTQMVDQYQVANPAVRQLLIDYLDRRCAEVTYSGLSRQACMLVRLFWKAIERINPEQANLRISEPVYLEWRSALTVLDDGSPRLRQVSVLMAIRAMYYDIQAWAVHEPERWAQWSVPCPIPRSEMRALAKDQRRARERTHATIRTLQPLLPVLVEHVESRYEHLRELIEHATDAGPDEQFTIRDQTYTRIYSREDTNLARRGERPRVHVRDETTGKRFDVTLKEDAAFWSWAIVETLRHSGLRIEELTELSHMSVRQYQRPNGEVIALLVVAPSKSDRERVIPMSAELFHVIALVIRRITAGKTSVPLATRYDDYQRITSDPQPFLFQRHIGQRVEVMTTGAIGTRLRAICEEIAATDPRFTGIHFRAHDFRHLFVTDLVNNGLPIHIGAALLGHLNLETTRGYVAVFDEDVTRHYQAHLQRRRATRPAEEYRPVTAEEWAEFEAHFDKRKVELGACGRPYATPCAHEHACIRCPMLHVDLKMITRLTEIETDLRDRRQRAQDQGWLGEIEGIDLTLTYLRDKLRDTQHRATRNTELGIPAMPKRERAKRRTT
ncbi:site-specific integrase [soil metagenome]